MAVSNAGEEAEKRALSPLLVGMRRTGIQEEHDSAQTLSQAATSPVRNTLLGIYPKEMNTYFHAKKIKKSVQERL